MKFLCAVLVLLTLVGCAKSVKSQRTREQIQLEDFISRCDKAKPTWTNKQKAKLVREVESRRIAVEKAILSSDRMNKARVVVSTLPQAINAGCANALYVSVDGVVSSVTQKRDLEDICRKHSDGTVSVYGSGVGITWNTLEDQK